MRPWTPAWLGVFILLLGLARLSAAESLQISEFMANNTRTLKDQSGSYHDWIEIYNNGADTANLGGWYLTDDAADLTKWPLDRKSVV